MKRAKTKEQLEIERLMTLIQLALDRLRYGEPDRCIIATLEKAHKESLIPTP